MKILNAGSADRETQVEFSSTDMVILKHIATLAAIRAEEDVAAGRESFIGDYPLTLGEWAFEFESRIQELL